MPELGVSWIVENLNELVDAEFDALPKGPKVRKRTVKAVQKHKDKTK